MRNKLIKLTLTPKFKVLTWRTWHLVLFLSYELRSQTSQSRNIKKMSSSNRRSIWIKLSIDRSRSCSVLQFRLRVLNNFDLALYFMTMFRVFVICGWRDQNSSFWSKTEFKAVGNSCQHFPELNFVGSLLPIYQLMLE